MHRLRPLLAAAFVLTSFGCAKSFAESAAAPPGRGYGGEDMAVVEAAPMADYDDADGYAERVEYEPSPTVASTSLGAAPPARPSTPPAGKPRPAAPPQDPSEPGVSAGQGDDEKDPQKQFARQIIYTAEMVISCFKLEDAMERAEALTLAVGGYVQTMSHGYFVLRIPAAKLRRVMDDLAKLGVVTSRSLQAQDVTQEYVDLTTRIRVLRETQSQLIALLKQARNVEEALQVRRSLDAITMELEQAMGRLRLLENQIGFSTLTLRLSERGPQHAIPSSNDPFPWVDTLGVEATEWN